MKFSNLCLCAFSFLSSATADQVGLRVTLPTTTTERCSTEETKIVQKSMVSFLGIQKSKKHQGCKSLCQGLRSVISCISIDPGCDEDDGEVWKPVPNERDYCDSACEGLTTQACVLKYPGCGEYFHETVQSSQRELLDRFHWRRHDKLIWLICQDFCESWGCWCSYVHYHCYDYEFWMMDHCRRKLERVDNSKDKDALKHDVNTFLTECESKKQAAYDFVADGVTVSQPCVGALEGMIVECYEL